MLKRIIACIPFLCWSIVFAQDYEWLCYSSDNSPLPGEWIFGIEVEQPGVFWVSTFGSGIFHYDGLEWDENYNSLNTGMPIDSVWPIAIDSTGNVWFGAFKRDGLGNGLFKFNGNNWTQYNTANSPLIGNGILSLEVDSQGKLWIGTDNGVSTFDGENWINYSPPDSSFHFVSAIGLGQNNTVWFGTNWKEEDIPVGGLYKYDIITGDWTNYNTGNSDLPHNFVFGIDFDNDGTVWLATLGGGAASFDGSVWEVYDTTNCEIANNFLFDILIDETETVWIASLGGGISKYDGTSWETYDTSNSDLTSNQVFQIEIDEKGTKYFAADNGLCIYSKQEVSGNRAYDSQPKSFVIAQNYPNPFNPVSTIQYDLPEATKVTLVVYDILGREVIRLVEQQMQPGYHKAVWDARDHAGRSMPTGIYIARLVTPAYTKSIKMLLLK